MVGGRPVGREGDGVGVQSERVLSSKQPRAPIGCGRPFSLLGAEKRDVRTHPRHRERRICAHAATLVHSNPSHP